jgi:hypothetical protein
VNWRLLVWFAPIGPVMGSLMVLGLFPRGADRFVWFAIVVATALVVARREPARALLHGAVAGFWNGATSTLVQALFLERLVANNPWFPEAFAKQPPGFDLDYFVFMTVPFIGVAGGAMTGALAMLAARVLAARRSSRRDGGETRS